MAGMIRRPDTAFQLSTDATKRRRSLSTGFLRYVHGKPCLICGAPGEAAHVRYGSIAHGKVETGAGRRPDDRWTVPLCPAHHREGPDAQHGSNERKWWQAKGIDPLSTAALLFSAFKADPDDEASARAICRHAKDRA